MTCFFPITAYRGEAVNPSGKRGLVFQRVKALTGEPIDLPCGRCIGCRLKKARDWAVRMVHESKGHCESSFITLTYDADHLPSFGSLEPRVFCLFMKRLRVECERRYGVRIRFYGCGEYGDLNGRPHYHVCVFGFGFPDKVLYTRSATGDIFSSKFLDSVWGLGATKVASFSFETAAYVARYCLKKVDGAARDAGHYVVYDADGVLHEREPEFARQSRRPGIGALYYAKYGSEVREHDSLVINGREVPSLRYYDKLFEAIDNEGLELVKRKRLRAAARVPKVERSSRRRVVKSIVAELLLKQKVRSL